jgi:heat shock protein HslJ
MLESERWLWQRGALVLVLVLAAIVAGCERHKHEPTDAPAAEPSGAAPSGIWSTAWRLTDLGGDGVIDGAEATLEFPEEGRVVGRGGCNRFFAIVAVTSETIRFSGIGSTRMACAEPLAAQEAKYLKALESAERFAIEGDGLVIHSSDLAEPLRFARASPPSTP